MKADNRFRINVGFLINAPVGEYREFDIDTPFIKIDEDTLFEDVHTVVRVSRVQQGILVSMKVKAQIELECVRCLESTSHAVESAFDDLYAFHLRQNIDSDNYLPEGGVIDLEPLLREYLTLEIPISPICKADCKGLCPECGANLNLCLCEHHAHVEQEL